MKKILITLIGLLALAGSVKAQDTNTPPVPAPPTSFFETAMQYFTSFNTNLDGTFSLSKGQAWAGVDSIQGGRVPLANNVGLSYKLWNLIGAEAVTRNGGVAGTVISQQAGVNMNFTVHDAQLTIYADGVYDIDSPAGTRVADRINAEIGLRVKKAMTRYTFAGVGIGAQFPASRQVFSAFVGFVF